jgi:hypothetical protein
MKQNTEQIKNRFSPTHQPINHNKNRPKKYLTPLLKKYLNKKIDYEDPGTKKIIHGKVKDAIVWRLLLNAAQGDNTAIKEIFDRLEGKAEQKLIGEGFAGDTRIFIISPKEVLKGEDANRINALAI